MAFEKYIERKQAFVFELDDVLYPQKDYLLQVYYLFAQFIEYEEQVNAAELLKYVQGIYLKEGDTSIFDKIAMQFNIPEKYRVNFELLLHSARLPLKLLLYNEVLRFLQEVVTKGKLVFLFTNGEPAMQLNKIKQLEWHGMEKYLKVYFAKETELKPSVVGLQQIINDYGLKKEEVLLIGKYEYDRSCALNAGIDFLEVDQLLLLL